MRRPPTATGTTLAKAWNLSADQRPAAVAFVDSERLAEVKRHWDPDGLIRANHDVSLTPV